jgi:hypothetical protein
MGYSTCLVSKAKWCINGSSAEQLAKMIKTAITDQEPGTVLLQFLDNSVYYAKAPDGSWLPPTADASGKYHMLGEIRVASRDTQLDHFRALSPVFNMLEQRKTLMITPLPRYISSSCCTDSSHGTNRTGPEYKKKMMADLDLMKRNLKDFIFKEGNRNMKLFDPNVDLRGLEEDDICSSSTGGVWEDSRRGSEDDRCTRRQGGFQTEEDQQPRGRLAAEASQRWRPWRTSRQPRTRK